MKKQIAKTIIALLIGSSASVLAATHYVDINNATPSAPYTNWVTAATNIQDAVDAAVAGETVLVTNGTYQLNAEVFVPESLRIEGVGVVAETIAVAVNSNRCFNLGAGVFLGGFTITNGYSATDGGGVICADESAMVSNCIISGNTAGDDGGGMYRGTAYGCDFIGNTALDDAGGAALVAPNNCKFIGNTAVHGGGYSSWASSLSPSNCVFIGNTAKYGGATYHSEAYDCVFSNNIAETSGGAMYDGIAIFNCTFVGNIASNKSGGAIVALHAYDCYFTNNWAAQHGGAMYQEGASNCTFIGNYANITGGAKSWYNSVMQDCVFISNSTSGDGGAVRDGQLYNCIFYGNTARDGGAVSEADLYNCIVFDNTAYSVGGGTERSAAYNSIIWSNSAPTGSDLYLTDPVRCCLSDYVTYPPSGSNIDCIYTDPQFVDAANADFHLLESSPCIDAGSNALAHVVLDFDGVPRPLDGDNNGSAIIDIGCYELLIATADSDGDAMPDGWEHDNGLNAAVYDATGNPDNDMHDNLSEYIAGTDPINSKSFFQITNAMDVASGFMIEWVPSISGREYTVLHEGSLTNSLTNLVVGIDFPQTSWTDTVHNTQSEGFYRVEVELK